MSPPRRGGVLAETRVFLAGRGWRDSLYAVARLAAYKRGRLVVIKAQLAGPPLDAGSDGLVFRQARAEDLDALETLVPCQRADRLRAFSMQGHWLHVARDGDRLVGFRHVSPDLSPRGILAAVVPMRADQVYTHDLFIHPDYRNRNVGRRLAVAQDRHLAALGFNEMLSAVDLDNVASLRMSFRKGSRPVCVVSYRRILLYRRCAVSPTLPPAVQAILDEVGAEEARHAPPESPEPDAGVLPR
jgi:GNAT superfamily N-acetyltransferase